MAVIRPKYGFEDLEVYQTAREFRKKMYAIARNLPSEEKFNLSSQLRRAALSVTNNIAEGHGRFHYLENIHFLLQSRGSLQELIDDIIACEDEKYCPETNLELLKDEAYVLLRSLNGYIAYLRKKKLGENES